MDSISEDAPYQGAAPAEEEEEGPGKRITLKLVMENALQPDEFKTFSKLDTEEALATASELKTIHLEFQDIVEIENLISFHGTDTLYLQRNRIRKIDGLEALPRLQFLALQHNRIQKVENLRHLQELEVLDLSSNQIEEFDVEEIPKSVNCLNLRGNPCAEKPDYKERLLKHLPDLAYLDGKVLDHIEMSQTDMAVMDGVRVTTSSSSEPRADGDVNLSAGEQGLGAYYRKDELQTGYAASVQGKIQAYSIEALADVDAIGSRVNAAVERSRARQRQTADSTSRCSTPLTGSLSQEQADKVKRLTQMKEQLQEQLAKHEESKENKIVNR